MRARQCREVGGTCPDLLLNQKQQFAPINLPVCMSPFRAGNVLNIPCLEGNRILTMKNVLFLGRKNLFIPPWMKKGGGRKGLYLPEGRTHCPQFAEKMEVTASPTLSPGLVWVLLSQPGCPKAPWKDLLLGVHGLAPLCWACFLHNLLES